MKRVLLTGMSGTGKSTLSRELHSRGYRSVDLDDAAWSEWAVTTGNPTGAKPGRDWNWRLDRVQRLLETETARPLFLAGCASNMGKVLAAFDDIVLLTAPVSLIEERLAARSQGAYGTKPGEVAAVMANLQDVEPRLRLIATHVVDTQLPLEATVDAIVRLATPPPATDPARPNS